MKALDERLLRLSRDVCVLWICVLALQACGAPLRPGQRWVKTLKLHGNQHLSSGAVIGGLKTRRTSWWPWAEKQVYDPADLDQDLLRVKAYYAVHGFFLARVVKHEVRKDPERRSVEVHLTVKEGPAALITAVKLHGLKRLSKGDRQRVTREPGLAVGQRFVHSTFQHAKALLRARLRKIGYAYAEVKAEARVRPKRTSVAIEISATAGPLVRFGRCIFKGRGPIPEDKLQAQVAWTPGERFDARKVVQTRNRLLNLRVFTAVNTAIPEKPTRRADVTITVRRAKLRELRLGVGLGIEKDRHEVHLRAHWTWRNFLGGLRTLSASVKPAFIAMPEFWDRENSGPGVESYVKLTQPNFLGSAFSLFGKIGYDVDVEEDYHLHGLELKVGAERFFLGTMLRWGVSWNLQYLDAFNLSDSYAVWVAQQDASIFDDPFRVAFLETFLQLDLRDDLVDPRAGFWAQARLELGQEYLGSAYNYLKISPEVRGYIPLGTKRLILAVRAMTGYLHPFGATDSPMPRRYRLGGATSHRGFSSGRLSPQVEGIDEKTLERKVFGAHGNFTLLMSADLRLRVVKLAGSWLHLGAFADGGDNVLDLDELEMDNLHWAVGGNLMYATPLGVINISLGFRLNRLLRFEESKLYNPDPNERVAFHIILGGAF